MVTSTSLKDNLSSVMTHLARAVVVQIFTVVEKIPLNKANAEAEEKLGTLVNSLCLDAVEKILKLVEQSVSEVKDPQPSDNEALMKTADDSDGQRPSEQSFVLLYQDAAVSSGCLLVELQSRADEDVPVSAAPLTWTGEDKSCDEPAEGMKAQAPSSSSPPQVDDHEYARPSSLPPPRAAAAEWGGVRKRPCSRRKKASWLLAAAGVEPHLQCSQCSMLFPNAERLSDHQKKSHPACSACGAMFTGILKLREHEIHEHRLLPYACDYCPKRFNHKAHRDLHVKTRHTGEKTCYCDICGKGYSCTSVLKTHRLTHFDKTFICDVCGKGFYHACHLTRHKLVHQDERPHHCATCGRGFTQAANLRSHQTTHSGERQLCSVCGKSFRCLKNHVISRHSHELPADQLLATRAIISCDVCGKKFPNLSQHRAHQRSHTGEKPFHCDVCGKSYRLKELLRDHRYTHSEEKPYRCSLCAKTFNLSTSFMRHRSIHSGRTPYSCTACNKHFRLHTFLKAHLHTKAHLKQAQHLEEAQRPEQEAQHLEEARDPEQEAQHLEEPQRPKQEAQHLEEAQRPKQEAQHLEQTQVLKEVPHLE